MFPVLSSGTGDFFKYESAPTKAPDIVIIPNDFQFTGATSIPNPLAVAMPKAESPLVEPPVIKAAISDLNHSLVFRFINILFIQLFFASDLSALFFVCFLL